MKYKIFAIDTHVTTAYGGFVSASIYRTDYTRSEYGKVTPASFARLQRAQVALLKRGQR